MVPQIEDCKNTLKSLHSSIDLVFLFDRPFRNDNKKEDRLNVAKMNSGYSISEQDMHPISINTEVGYPGPHDKILR